MIRLFVIEDHAAIIVAGFKRLFYSSRDGIEVAGYSTSVEDAMEKADPGSFDIFILDLWLENKLPVNNIRNLKQHFPGKPIIIYTSEGSLVWKKRMLDEHAMAYIIKSATRAEIKAAIESVSKGAVYYPVNLNELNSKKVLMTTGGQAHSLTPVQKEILMMLAQGSSHKQIAGMIGISPSGLEKILKSLRDQFNAKNNIELLTLLDDMTKP